MSGRSATARSLSSVTLVIGSPAPARAQFVVYDPTNWAQAVLQVDADGPADALLAASSAAPAVDIASRYHGHSVEWTLHDLDGRAAVRAAPAHALNTGDPTGAAYRDSTPWTSRRTCSAACPPACSGA